MVSSLLPATGLLLSCIITLTLGKVQLKVGLYNYLFDLQEDGLASLKEMVEKGFNDDDHEVNAVVNDKIYSPYAGKDQLNKYLNEGFDLIEIDTANLLDVKDNIMTVNAVKVEIQKGTLETAKNSVKDGDFYYGYPTLACGNFIVALSPATPLKCPLNRDLFSFPSIKIATETCKASFPTYARFVGGKMSSLPTLYLDGYVDIHGADKIKEGIVGKIDKTVCEGLVWLLSQCQAEGETLDTNKCFSKTVEGSYAEDTDHANIIGDIKDKKTLTYFGFSEVSAEINKKVELAPYAVTSWPFSNDDNSYMLQFTDALVVSKKAWEEGEDKQNAIKAFIDYFTASTLRRKIALGEDLTPVRNRYLLQTIDSFYESVSTDPVYTSAYKNLKKSVAAPALSKAQKTALQEKLEAAIKSNCVILPEKEL